MSGVGFIVIGVLVVIIVMLIVTVLFQREVINQVFEANHDLKERMFDLIKEEEKWCTDLFEGHRLRFDEKCLYDVVRRVEVIEKELKEHTCKCKKEGGEKKTIDVYNPKQ